MTPNPTQHTPSKPSAHDLERHDACTDLFGKAKALCTLLSDQVNDDLPGARVDAASFVRCLERVQGLVREVDERLAMKSPKTQAARAQLDLLCASIEINEQSLRLDDETVSWVLWSVRSDLDAAREELDLHDLTALTH